jgi:hypothetical protein
MEGICHICGTYGKLTFEHTPPEAAFNDHRVLRADFRRIFGYQNPDDLRAKVQQRGAGAYTLCETCNNIMGHWYGGAYAQWARQAMRYLILARGQPSLSYPYNLFPLRVLKQVVCMLFSVNGPQFQGVQPELVRFVLNRDSNAFPPHVRVYVFYTFSARSRASGVTGIVRGFGTSKSTFHALSEITFPPFGFTMTLGDDPPPAEGLCEISGFSQFQYRDWRASLSMKLPLMPIYAPFPSDYRSPDQVRADFEAGRKLQPVA